MNPDLNHWLLFQDKDSYSPVRQDFFLVRGFCTKESSESDKPDWRREEWSVRSVLVYKDRGPTALERFEYSIIKIAPWWRSESDFDFGLSSTIKGIKAESLYFERKHSLSGKLLSELRHDFVIYHGLEIRKTDEGVMEYYHPLDNMPVARIKIEEWWPFEPYPLVTIHSDYLRDYLAARKSSLVICQVSDRFANSLTPEEFGITSRKRHKIEPGFWMQNDVFENDNKEGLCQARSTLWRNFFVAPYERPKAQRGPWPYFYSSHEESEARFIVDEQGNTSILDADVPTFLYFRRDVLAKFLNTPGYSIFFHMRHWGIAGHPGGKAVDVGINSDGYVTAFTPDLQALSPQDQAYWSSYSSRPIGEICEELFKTRMQNNPPHSPGVHEIISDALSDFNNSFSNKFSTDILNQAQPSRYELAALTLGPLKEDHLELFPLSKTLYQWTVERIQIHSLKIALEKESIDFDENERQILLLERLCRDVLGCPEQKTALVTDRLRGLNKLRQSDAHLGRADINRAFQKLGYSSVPRKVTNAWEAIVDGVGEAFKRMSDLLI